MTVMDGLRAFGVLRRIEAEDDRDNFAPVGTVRCGIEQTQIGDKMALVIAVDALGLRGRDVESRYRHRFGLALEHVARVPTISRLDPVAVDCAIRLRGERCARNRIGRADRLPQHPTALMQIARIAKRVGMICSDFAVEHDCRIDVEGSGELFEHIDGCRVFGPLKHPDIVAIDPGTVRKLLLRQALGVPDLA